MAGCPGRATALLEEASCRVSSSLRDAPFRLCVGASRRLDDTLRQSGPVLSNGETTLDVALLRSLRRSSAGRERPREEHCFSGDSKVVARFRHPCFVLVRLEDSTTPYGRGASRRLDDTLRGLRKSRAIGSLRGQRATRGGLDTERGEELLGKFVWRVQAPRKLAVVLD